MPRFALSVVLPVTAIRRVADDPLSGSLSAGKEARTVPRLPSPGMQRLPASTTYFPLYVFALVFSVNRPAPVLVVMALESPLIVKLAALGKESPVVVVIRAP